MTYRFASNFCAFVMAMAFMFLSEVALGEGTPEEPKKSAETELAPLPLDQLRTFADVFDRIKNAYVEEIDDTILLENAIKGMLYELDPHSAYLGPEDFQDLQISTTGEFGGLGIEVGMEDGFIKVITPIDDTPAKKAGVEPGDLIIKLDNRSVKGMSLSEAIDIMRGEPGTDINLTIIRAGNKKPVEIKIIRDIIQVQNIKSRLLESGYGYIRIAQFQVHTGSDTIKAITRLTTESGGSLKGLVVDLRNNPGGVLQAAVDVSDIFLDGGSVVETKGRLADSNMKFSATPGDLIEGTPVIVLVNAGSASASEIVAGALQHYNRAVILGTTTFGKGSVQTILPLDKNRALKLTTARYYTPSGLSIQASGINPDIVTEDVKLSPVKKKAPYKESDLSRHLENPESNKNDQQVNDKPIGPSLLESDFQLYTALNVLKALNIVNQPTVTIEEIGEETTDSGAQ
jgi:carboxyl-terminal processing protease